MLVGVYLDSLAWYNGLGFNQSVGEEMFKEFRQHLSEPGPQDLGPRCIFQYNRRVNDTVICFSVIAIYLQVEWPLMSNRHGQFRLSNIAT